MRTNRLPLGRRRLPMQHLQRMEQRLVLHRLCREHLVFSAALDRDPVQARLDPEVRVAVGLVLEVLDMADPGHLGHRV
jgi:hypothetical protein